MSGKERRDWTNVEGRPEHPGCLNRSDILSTSKPDRQEHRQRSAHAKGSISMAQLRILHTEHSHSEREDADLHDDKTLLRARPVLAILRVVLREHDKVGLALPWSQCR